MRLYEPITHAFVNAPILNICIQDRFRVIALDHDVSESRKLIFDVIGVSGKEELVSVFISQ